MFCNCRMPQAGSKPQSSVPSNSGYGASNSAMVETHRRQQMEGGAKLDLQKNISDGIHVKGQSLFLFNFWLLINAYWINVFFIRGSMQENKTDNPPGPSGCRK